MEQVVQGLWRHAFRFWQPEECPSDQNQCQPSSRESCLALQISLRRVQHIWCDNDVDNRKEVVHVAAEGDGFCAQVACAHFCCDGVGNGANSNACSHTLVPGLNTDMWTRCDLPYEKNQISSKEHCTHRIVELDGARSRNPTIHMIGAMVIRPHK